MTEREKERLEERAFTAGFMAAQEGVDRCCGCNCGDPDESYDEWVKARAAEAKTSG